MVTKHNSKGAAMNIDDVADIMLTENPIPTMWVVDPDDPNPDGLVEMDCETYLLHGGDLGALRADAAATNDWDLVAMIDEYLTS